MGKLQYINKRLLFYTIICGIGSIVYGWEVGMLNIIYSMRASFGAKFGLYEFNPQKKIFDETEDKNLIEMIVTPSFTVGGIIGSILILYIIDRIGRSNSLRLGSIIYMAGVIVQVCCNNIFTLCLGRFIAGVASGIALGICPLYLAEIAPKQVRGTLGIVNPLGLQLGMLFSCLFDTLCLKLITKNMSAQWRTAFAGLLIPATLFLLLVWFLPETPRFLLLKNKEDQALKTLAKIRGQGDCHPSVVEEFNEMNARLKQELSEGICSWKELVQTKNIFYRVVIVSILQLLHMLVGVNAIGYYSTQIYSKYLGISLAKYGAWLATLQNLISFICTLPAMRYIENVGRKPILKWGAFGLGVCMVSIYALCHITDSIKDSNKGLSQLTGWLCVLIMYLFSVIYGWSWSSVVFVWQAEVFPIRMRAKANSVGTFFQYIGSLIVGSTTTTLMKYLSFYTFLIYAGFCLISFIFASLCVRETKGLSLEEMEQLYGDSKSADELKVKREIDEKKAVNNVES
ncbi:general substrate transporter [Piromyces finnis]|uniref:General substrate transporter n=1 Tax=Piromyces finnis TaxID=1754191 RepID=A0A1Y1VJB7_9FUNG|nr:general substrate transporter [Piromyces finnis]|eukprot:ORX56496.1 general substrate transporter [Piromyces finnis]